MKQNKKLCLRLAALFLAVLLLFTACKRPDEPDSSGSGNPETEPGISVTDPARDTGAPDDTTTQTQDTTPSETKLPVDPDDEALIRWKNGGMKDYREDVPIDVVPFSEMEYVRPDVERLYTGFDVLTALAAGDADAETLLRDYYDLYDQYISFYSMDALANVRYSLNETDRYYKTEYDFCEAETPNLEEKLEALNKAFAASPERDELERLYFGKGYFERFDDYEVYTNPEYLRLSQEEAALLSEYREMSADPQVSYKGQTKSLDEWMETDNYATYIGALKAYYEQYNESLGELYVRLVKVRRQLAEALDYESYADYSYEISYTRDYSPAQGKAFLDGIREHLLPVLSAADRSAALAALGGGSASERQVMELLQSAAENIGGPVWDAYRFMRAYELCDIAQSAKKVEASFQTYFYDYEAPFVLVNSEGSTDDYTTFAHEFGHFTDAYHNYGANEDLETAETFSQAMELLALRYNDVLSERQKERLIKNNLCDLLQTFVYQAAYADFETRVYALDPKALSVEAVNELYRQTCKDYGIYEKNYDFYYSQGWIDVLHFFEVPYYIISYCVSAETALQVYELEAEQEGEGVQAYFRLLDRSYEAGVQQVMEDAGLENPFREEVLEEAAAFFQKALGLKKG